VDSLLTSDAVTAVRFVAVSVPGLQDKLGTQMKDVESDVESLTKRLQYLETTAKNSQQHIEKMLGGGGRS